MASDLAAFRDSVLEDVRQNFREDFYSYRESVLTDGGVDDKRKLTEINIRLLGLEPKAKDDPYAGKTVVSITVVNGSTQIKALQPVVEVEATEVPDTLENAVAARPLPSVDVKSLVEDLDNLLGLAE